MDGLKDWLGKGVFVGVDVGRGFEMSRADMIGE